MRKSMSKLATQSSFRAVGQTHVELQTFENPENKTQMYGSLCLTAIHLSLIFGFLKYLPFCVCLANLKI